MSGFNVGDKVKVISYGGKVILKSVITEITMAGNIRVKGWDKLFKPNGTERSKQRFWTDYIHIVKEG